METTIQILGLLSVWQLSVSSKDVAHEAADRDTLSNSDGIFSFLNSLARCVDCRAARTQANM